MKLDFNRITEAVNHLSAFFTAAKEAVLNIEETDDVDTIIKKIISFYTLYKIQLYISSLYINGITTKKEINEALCEKLAVNYSWNKKHSEKALVDGESPLKNSDPGWLVYLPNTGVAPTEANTCGKVYGINPDIDWSNITSFTDILSGVKAKSVTIKNPKGNGFAITNSSIEELTIVNPTSGGIGQNFGNMSKLKRLYGCSINGTIPGYAIFHYRTLLDISFSGKASATTSKMSSSTPLNRYFTTASFFIKNPTDEWLAHFADHCTNYNTAKGGKKFIPDNSVSYGYSRPYWRMSDTILNNYMNDYNLSREDAKTKIQSFFTPVGWKVIYDDSDELFGESPLDYPKN